MSPSTNPFLFQPGAGRLPPYLAGREVEQGVLQQFLGALQAGEGPPGDVTLIGPRGNGKTVLLRWFEQQLQAGDVPLDVLWLTPTAIPTEQSLIVNLAPKKLLEKILPERVKMAGVEWEFSWGQSLTNRLVKRCQGRPLALLLDEAHTLAPKVGQTLLNVSQETRAKAPFLLALAGTPSLQTHLNTMGATFWNRAEKLGIGRLDEAATAEALVRPLAGQGVRFTGAALDQVVVESQCYPYFIQLWGQALWTQARVRGAECIDLQLVDSVRPTFVAQRDSYYEDRREELRQRGLDAVAARLAVAFRDRSVLPEHELEAVIGRDGAGNDTTSGLLEQMKDLGYVWKPPGRGPDWEPGIPSLMDYVQLNTPPNEPAWHSGRCL